MLTASDTSRTTASDSCSTRASNGTLHQLLESGAVTHGSSRRAPLWEFVGSAEIHFERRARPRFRSPGAVLLERPYVESRVRTCAGMQERGESVRLRVPPRHIDNEIRSTCG